MSTSTQDAANAAYSEIDCDPDALLLKEYPELEGVRLGTTEVWEHINSVMTQIEISSSSASMKIHEVDEWLSLIPEKYKGRVSNLMSLLTCELLPKMSRLTAKVTSCPLYLLQIDLSGLSRFRELRVDMRQFARLCQTLLSAASNVPLRS